MKFDMTEQQFSLLKTVVEVMTSFYENDLLVVLHHIGKLYAATDADIEKSYNIIASHHATAPVWSRVAFLKELQKTIESAKAIDKKNPNPNKDDRYVWQICLHQSERMVLSEIMSLYSALTAGQFEHIFTELDIPLIDSENKERIRELHDLCWYGLDCMEARGLLVPLCADMDWTTHIGITNEELSVNSRLAYEMAHVFQQPDDFVLFVSGHSMMLAED